MAPYFGIPPTGIATWDRHWPLDGSLVSGIGGAPLLMYDASGVLDPTALRYSAPIPGTQGISFSSDGDLPTRFAHLAITDPALAIAGDITIAMIVCMFMYGRTVGSFFRYGLDPAIRSWAAEADNDLYAGGYLRVGGSLGPGNFRSSWMSGPTPDTIARVMSIGFNEAMPALVTWYRSGDATPRHQVTVNGLLAVDTTDAWPGDFAPPTVTPLVLPTGGTTPDAKLFFGECMNGVMISPAIKFGALTGTAGKSVGQACDGEIGALYAQTLGRIWRARR